MISPRRMAAHDWTPHSPPDRSDGVANIDERCPCGARRTRAVSRRKGQIVYDIVVWVEYPDNAGSGFLKEQCPHTGRLP